MAVNGELDRGFVEVEESTISVVTHWWVAVALPTWDVWDEGMSCVVNVFDPMRDRVGVA